MNVTVWTMEMANCKCRTPLSPAAVNTVLEGSWDTDGDSCEFIHLFSDAHVHLRSLLPGVSCIWWTEQIPGCETSLPYSSIWPVIRGKQGAKPVAWRGHVSKWGYSLWVCYIPLPHCHHPCFSHTQNWFLHSLLPWSDPCIWQWESDLEIKGKTEKENQIWNRIVRVWPRVKRRPR